MSQADNHRLFPISHYNPHYDAQPTHAWSGFVWVMLFSRCNISTSIKKISSSNDQNFVLFKERIWIRKFWYLRISLPGISRTRTNPGSDWNLNQLHNTIFFELPENFSLACVIPSCYFIFLKPLYILLVVTVLKFIGFLWNFGMITRCGLLVFTFRF